jgi:CBS domain-containing protein
MKKWIPGKEIRAILISILFLALGFLAIWFSRQVLGVEGEALFIFLLLAPILAYAIFSGRLTELKAGGMEAKFSDIGTQAVDVGSETIEPSVEEMEVVAKAGVRELGRTMDRVDKSKPMLLTLTLGRQGYYNPYALLNYVESLAQFANFKFVVILDKDGHFVASLTAWAMLQILRNQALGGNFVEIVNGGSEAGLKQYPGVVTRAISTTTTNLEALKEMTARNSEALVVIDAGKKLAGVVEREQILSKLMLALAH